MAKVFQEYELEYQKLKLVADMLTTFSPNGTVYIVDVTWLDFGQDWKWLSTELLAMHQMKSRKHLST